LKFLFDIDDTILFSDVDENGDYELKYENKKLIEKLNGLHDAGNQVILWTGRHWNHLEITQKQLLFAGVKYDTLIMGKPPVDYYVEDKALRPAEFLSMEF